MDRYNIIIKKKSLMHHDVLDVWMKKIFCTKNKKKTLPFLYGYITKNGSGNVQGAHPLDF